MITFDTNVLVYAFDETEGKKHEIAVKLLERCLLGEEKGVIPLHVLSEASFVLTKKMKKPLKKDKVHQILGKIVNAPHIQIIRHDENTNQKALQSNAPFWDALIAETCIENHILEIHTENVKDFETTEITAINPFKQ